MGEKSRLTRQLGHQGGETSAFSVEASVGNLSDVYSSCSDHWFRIGAAEIVRASARYVC